MDTRRKRFEHERSCNYGQDTRPCLETDSARVLLQQVLGFVQANEALYFFADSRNVA
jgi:hypothetical protein